MFFMAFSLYLHLLPGLLFLCKTNCLDDFGFDVLNVDRTWNQTHLEITVVVRAPSGAKHLWEFGMGYLPVIDPDRFSHVENLERNGVITSRLHTTKVDVGYVNFKVYTYSPYFMGIDVKVKTKKENAMESYNNTCQYTPPSHAVEDGKVSTNITFVCDTIPGQDLSATDTGISYRAETLDKRGITGEILFSLTSDDITNRIANGKVTSTKTISKNKAWVDKRGGVLGVFVMKINKKYRDSSPLYGFGYFIEDDFSFDGTSNNPFEHGVFSPYYFTVNLGGLMASRRQAFISCFAIGYKIPEVDIFKLSANGTEITPQYPRMVLKTKYSVTLRYVINYPTEDDAGTYLCRARVDGREKTLNHTGYYEPDVPPEIVRARSGIVWKFYEDTIQLIVKSPEDVDIACYLDSKNGRQLEEHEVSWFKTQKDRTRVTDYFIGWPRGKFGYTAKRVYCKASNIYGEDWILIDENSRLR